MNQLKLGLLRAALLKQREPLWRCNYCSTFMRVNYAFHENAQCVQQIIHEGEFYYDQIRINIHQTGELELLQNAIIACEH